MTSPAHRAVALATLLLVGLTACTDGDPTGPAPDASGGLSATAGTGSPTGTPVTPPEAGTPVAVRVELTRSGGIAGVEDTLTVEPDGRWTLVGRTGTGRTGRLTPADLERLRQLAADPRLRTEPRGTAPPADCRDAFAYRLTVGTTVTRWTDCPTDERPGITAALVDLLTRATA